MVERRGAQRDEHLARRRRPDPGRLRTAAPPARRPRGCGSLSRAQSCHDRRRAGPARCGARPRRGRRRTRRRRTRRRSGTSASGVSAASSRNGLHDGAARGLLSSGDAAARRADRDLGGALLLRARGRSPGRGRGGSPATPGPTATPSCARSSTRSAAGSAARTACSSTRTSTSTARAPRAPASASTARTRSLITRRHGSWVVLGTLVSDVEVEPSRAARRRLRLVHALHRRVPDRTRSTSPARSTRPAASRTGRRRRTPMPEPYRAELGALVYGCDICQDVCPWNRGVEKRRAGVAPPAGAEPTVSLAGVARGGRGRAGRALRPALRPAQRSALAAPERARRGRQRRRRRPSGPLWSATPRATTTLLARARRAGRSRGSTSGDRRVKLIRTRRVVRLAIVPLALAADPASTADDFPAGYEAAAWSLLARARARRASRCSCSRRPLARPPRRLALLSVLVDASSSRRCMFVFAWEPGQPLRSLLFLVVLEAALFFRLRGGLIAAALHAAVLVAARVVARGRVRHHRRSSTRSSCACWSRSRSAASSAGSSSMERGQARAAASAAAEAERLRDELGRRDRRARGDEPRRARARLFARPRRGVRGLRRRSCAACCRSTAPRSSLARATARAGDGDRRRRRRRAARRRAARSQSPDSVARGGDRAKAGRSTARTSRDAALPRGGAACSSSASRSRVARAAAARARARSARSRSRAPSRRRSAPRRSSSSRSSAGSSRRPSRTCAPTRPSGRPSEELRRLSALRADFVSLVSHELRSPMAAVIGSARTLQQRWRELRPEQREAFLAVIADETTRLSALVGDVLDTSRIEAGTFGYAFSRRRSRRGRARLGRRRRDRAGRGAAQRRRCRRRCRTCAATPSGCGSSSTT